MVSHIQAGSSVQQTALADELLHTAQSFTLTKMECLKKVLRLLSVHASESENLGNGRNETNFPNKSETPHADIKNDEECGFDLYPERRALYQPSLWNKIWKLEGRETFDRLRCEKKLYRIMKEAPLIKLMFGALKSSGCDIDLRRNFSCEICAPGVRGGYDRYTHQIVICQNNVKDETIMSTVLTHELIHMYDHCVNKTDFRLLDHLACSEIRAANLTSCSILGAFLTGNLNVFELLFMQYDKKHATCVKNQAFQSVKAARNVTEEEAREAVERVFPYCYNDLEPIGRRLRSGSEDAYKAYLEGHYYGYI